MIKGIGLDLQQVDRVQRALENERFQQRVYTQSEQNYLASRGAMRAQSAAGMWAAKEAVLKALGIGIGQAALDEIEIGHDDSGAPVARLCGAALVRQRALGVDRVFVSITHDGGFAAAMCVTENLQ